MKAALVRMIPMLCVMGIIFILSHQPGTDEDRSLFPGDDKIAHMIVYGVLAAAVIASFAPDIRKSKSTIVVGLAFIVSLLYGVSDEFHQSFIPGRFSSGADILADAAGAGLICVTWLVLVKRKAQRKGVYS
ncbi:MAG: VanZ family protein [Deltaproteobacteria bacterium]|nr:VanZ family protein [Deltaproteobacteria bacterium]